LLLLSVRVVEGGVVWVEAETLLLGGGDEGKIRATAFQLGEGEEDL
jgi:hypothetical protein